MSAGVAPKVARFRKRAASASVGITGSKPLAKTRSPACASTVAGKPAASVSVSAASACRIVIGRLSRTRHRRRRLVPKYPTENAS